MEAVSTPYLPFLSLNEGFPLAAGLGYLPGIGSLPDGSEREHSDCVGTGPDYRKEHENGND